MSTKNPPLAPGEIDLSRLPAENRAVLERIAAMRGLTVAATVAALVKEETDRVIQLVTPDNKEAA